MYGPLVCHFEAADNHTIDQGLGAGPLRTQWNPGSARRNAGDQANWADGSELSAIPNYARMNRVGPPPGLPGEEESGGKEHRKPAIQSKVWI